MNTGRKVLALAFGLCLAAISTTTRAQNNQAASTNSPAPAIPPLPPLPPSFRLPTNAQRNIRFPQYTNYQQRLRTIQGATNAAGAPVVARTTNSNGQFPPPLSPPFSALTNRPAPVVGQLLPLVADADLKEYTAKPGEANAQLTFTLTNTSPAAVTINDVRTSCGCTVAKLPSQPWTLEPGTNGQIHVTVDLRGKHGQITKLVYVNGATGMKTLTVRVNIPDTPPLGPPPGVMADRARNIQVATADRQAVFKNDCAKCHAEPAAGKNGEALYLAVCANCHDSEHRASMVPNLLALNHPTDREQWKTWVTHGKAGTLMPAFAKAEGGPLTDGQIASLVDYLAEHIPSRPAAAAPIVPSAKRPATE